MKEKAMLFSFIALMIWSLSSCVYVFENQVSGSGNVVSDIRQVDEFDEINASRGLNVYVQFGEQVNEVEVVADDNLQEYITTEVRDRVLIIKAERGFRRYDSKDIYVKAAVLKDINASSAASVKGQGINITDRLDLDASSAGSIEIETEVKELNANASSSGQIRLEGLAGELKAIASSAGDIKASDLIAEKASLNASSAGNISVTVTGELEADASSAGNIRYSGEPNIKRINSSSAGNVSKR